MKGERKKEKELIKTHEVKEIIPDPERCNGQANTVRYFRSNYVN